MENRCMIKVEWVSLSTVVGFLFFVVVLVGVPSAFGGLYCWLEQWIGQEEVSNKLVTSLVDYALVIQVFLGVTSVVSGFVILFNFASISNLFSRVRVYLNGRLVASGKANVFFYVPLSRPGDIYEVKWGKETFPLRLYSRRHYEFHKGDFGWGYHDY